MAFTVVAVLMAALVHYLYGGIRLQTSHDRLSGRRPGAAVRAARASSCSPRPVDYWLDRFDLVTRAAA